MIYQGSKRTPVTEVVLHCAAIKTGQFHRMSAFQVFATVNRWHTERGFKGFGYHGLIMPSGEWFAGRPFDKIGAHVIGHNTGTIGLLLIESKEIKLPKGAVLEDYSFDDWFTQEQEFRLRVMLDDLRVDHGIKKVSGHNDYAPKLCPGFKVAEWL